MKITELTPPVERKFTLELTENELKLLGLIVGDCTPGDVKSRIADKEWTIECFPGVKWDDNFIQPLYDGLVEVFKS